ncbi:MAG: hypothetical protein ACE14M_00795 [Terriglobales bacterium]
MIRALRRTLQRSRYYGAWKQLGALPDYWYWRLRGKPVRSPHYVKQQTVKQYAREFDLHLLVEAGTYFGEMVQATRQQFREIYSVELEDWLFERAREKFAPYPHIHMLHGNSEVLVPQIVSQLNEPALFWLDAGYYGFAGAVGNPDRIIVELTAILTHRISDHVVLIDDARAFTGKNGAASLEDMKELVRQKAPGRVTEVRDDIVRIHQLRSIPPLF